jgi:hypothetical protein
MSSFLSKRVDNTQTRDDATLVYRIKALTSVLDEQDELVAGGCHVLRNASHSLASVRSKYEPLKEHAATLSLTAANASLVNEDLHKLIASLRVHQKVRIRHIWLLAIASVG